MYCDKHEFAQYVHARVCPIKSSMVSVTGDGFVVADSVLYLFHRITALMMPLAAFLYVFDAWPAESVNENMV